jgi:hypothetical protein
MTGLAKSWNLEAGTGRLKVGMSELEMLFRPAAKSWNWNRMLFRPAAKSWNWKPGSLNGLLFLFCCEKKQSD